MERRKDKNNHVLKDGESYREKEHRYMYRWVDSDKNCLLYTSPSPRD